MSRNTDYKFVATDSESIVSQLIAVYEKMTSRALQPDDPDRTFIAWVASVIVQERVNQNYVGNQNIPSRAEGANLDALGEWIYSLKRKGAQAAKTTMRFYITQTQTTSVLIPKGTKVTDRSSSLVWATTNDAMIEIGSLYADVMAQCQTAGEIGNGFSAGQICTLMDIDNINFFDYCENITESDGGAEEENDETYFEMMKSSLNSYTTAGPKGSYEYLAKSVSDKIADVKAICPLVGQSATLTLYTDSAGDKFAFVSGEGIDINSLSVRESENTGRLSANTDYTTNYSDGLLTIALMSDTVYSRLNSVYVTFNRRKAGHVYIYALMDDGEPAGEEIKEGILSACNDDYERPLTDLVSVHDAQKVNYDIDVTYYISEDTQLSLADIQIAVNNAVGEYIAWQRAKLGRDINPSELHYRLKQAGVKRVMINSPVFTHLDSGDSGGTPQIAAAGTVTITNGGYEDE